MRTIAEIRDYIIDKLDAHEQEKADAAKRAQDLRAAIAADKAAQNEAAENDDAIAHKDATVSLAFHQAQLEVAQKAELAPAFTRKELEALGNEMNASRRAAMAPIVQKMEENRREAHDLYKQAEAIESACTNVWAKTSRLHGGAAIPFAMIHPAVKALFSVTRDDHIFTDQVAVQYKKQ